MAYNVSHMIGIRIGGVFSDDIDIKDVRTRVLAVAQSMDDGFHEQLPNAISNELVSQKGSYVVIAGVFNYWPLENATEFARRLSLEFGTEVLHMGWDEQTDACRCQMYLDGRPYFEVDEHPIGQIVRRVSA